MGVARSRRWPQTDSFARPYPISQTTKLRWVNANWKILCIAHTDVNECAIASEVNCKENEVCKNTLGSYKCHCKPGYYEESEHQCMKGTYDS